MSSARAVRCRLKCHNERNPRVQLPAIEVGHSGRTAGASREEGGDDVKSARPLRPGRHTCYNGVEQREATWRQGAEPENTSQFGLESATRLHEVGIASNSRSACSGECVPGPCTHRPSHHESRFYPKPVSQLAIETAVYGRTDDWGEVVTR